MVKVICDGCGKEIWQYPSQVKRSKEHFCSQADHARWHKEHDGEEVMPDEVHTTQLSGESD